MDLPDRLSVLESRAAPPRRAAICARLFSAQILTICQLRFHVDVWEFRKGYEDAFKYAEPAPALIDKEADIGVLAHDDDLAHTVNVSHCDMLRHRLL